MEQILKLEDTDDVASIRNRIDFALPQPISSPQDTTARVKPKRQRLLLIVPRKNKALQSLVNMKLLARIAKTRAVELAIVSDHPMVRDYAKEAGIKAFGNLKSAKWTRWVTSKAPVTPPDETAPPVVSFPHKQPGESEQKSSEDSSEAQKTDTRKQSQKKKYVVVTGSGRVGIFQQLGALMLVCVLALALVLAVITLLPQATVTLTPVAQTVETELIVKADPNAKSVDFQTLTFPARVAQVELAMSGQIETIETELAPVGQAEGPVIFINRTEDEQIIPISTTVSTSAGEQIDFITVETATIPASIGAITSTQVRAVEPGPQGNAAAGKINRFGEPSFALLARVINETPMIGGSMEPAKVVVQADKERLQAHLRQKIQQEGLAQLEESLEEQEFISPETLQVIVLDVTYKEFSGDFSDTFSGEMQAVVRGTVVGGYNANRLALTALETQVPPGFELDIEGLHFGAGEVLDVRDGVVTFKIFAAGRCEPVIDPRAVAQEIAWLPIGEAQTWLGQQYALATVPGVELKPDWAVDWLGRLPYYSVRINVVIREAVIVLADGG